MSTKPGELQTGLLASMADNFAGFIIHRQTAPESRDWLAKLMGTTALWQSTDQTNAPATGAGSRRRVREFRISSDTFAELRLGEAVIHTTLGPPPTTCHIHAPNLPPDNTPQRIGDSARHVCEINVHPATHVPAAKAATPDANEAPASMPTPESLTAAEWNTSHVAPDV